jgi:hypothetical protein
MKLKITLLTLALSLLAAPVQAQEYIPITEWQVTPVRLVPDTPTLVFIDPGTAGTVFYHVKYEDGSERWFQVSRELVCNEWLMDCAWTVELPPSEHRATVYFAGRGSFDLFSMYYSPLGLYVRS